MSNFFFSRNAKGGFRKLISGTLAFLLLVQMFGPGLFAVQQALAATNVPPFPETFGNGSGESDTVTGWTEIESNPSYAKISDDSGLNPPSNRKHVRLMKGASISKTIDATNFTNLALSYYWKGDSDSEDSGKNQDYLKVFWKKDSDSTFTLLNQHGNLKAQKDSWVSVSLPLSQADNSVFQLRFVGDTTGLDEQARIDDILITGEEGRKINICHQTGAEKNPWEAIRINASAWDGGPDHKGHGDFLYEGPIDEANQQPTKDGNLWCADNNPNNHSEEPNIDLSKTVQYNGNDVATYTINWKISDGNVDNLTVTDTLPAWTDMMVNSMTPSTTPPLTPGARNYDKDNPTANREVVWNLGPQQKGAEGTITFKVELSVDNTCKISPNKVLASATYGDNTIKEDAISESINIESERCNDNPPPAPVCEVGVELIKNGGFENPQVNNSYGWNIFDSGFTGLEWGVNWMTLAGEGRPDIAKLELHDGVNLWAPKDGEQYAELDADWGGPTDSQSGEPASVQIYQDIPTLPGKNYDLKFSFSPRPGTNASDNILGVMWGGEIATSTIITDSGSSNTSWTDYVLRLKATSTLTRVSFSDLGIENSQGTFLDNVSVQCAPECNPTSGSIFSDETDIVSKIEVDGEDPITPETQAIPVSVVAGIQSLGANVWDADVSNASAKWIWSEDPYDADWQVDKWVTFKKTFNVIGEPQTGTLNIAADNSYEVWINGNPVTADPNEDNHSLADGPIDVASYLVDGLNTLEIRVKNMALPNSPQQNNPGGLLYSLSWTAKDCDNGEPNDPGTSKVVVRKYIDGEAANSKNASEDEFKIQYNTSSGSGDVILGGNNNYTWDSPELTNFSATADVSESTTETNPANEKVIPLGGECRPGAYRLAGYSVGNSFSNAESNATTSSVHINIQDSNKYVIIWNETCPDKPSLNLVKSASYATSTGEITFNIDWSVNNGDVSDLVVTDAVPTGLTFISADNGGTHDAGTPGVVSWNLGSQSSGANGTVSFVASLNAWNSGLKWASGYEDNNQAKNKDGSNIALDRKNPASMFGAPQTAGNIYDTVVNGSFFSLGFDGGNIVTTFDGTIFNGAGDDLKVYEVTGGTNYPDELVKVEAWDGTQWVDLGNVNRDGSVDLGSLSSTTKIRLTDASNKSLFEATADGYDVDAVEALNILPNVCGVDNTVTATASYDDDGTIRASASVNLEINKSMCKKPPVEPQVASVQACKIDNKENPLADWTLMLLNGSEIENLSVDSSVLGGVNTINPLVAGTSYVAIADGVWNNQGGNNPVDAEYSTTDGWLTQMDGYTGFGNGILELEIDGNDGAWGPYSSLHKYAQAFVPSADGPVNFGIFDGVGGIQNPSWFDDNSGSLAVKVYKGYAGVTGENGCVTFNDVPYGTYTTDEIAQDGWTRMDDNSSIVIDQPNEEFTVVNKKSANGDGEPSETFTFGTTTIYSSNLAGNISDGLGDITKWFFYNDETDVIDNSLGSFVFGPATAALGNGSAQMSVTGPQRRNIATYQFKDIKLSDIKTLRFSTYSQSSDNGSPLSERSAYLNFNVDFNNSDTWQKRLVYLPSLNGAVINDAWQTWDAINGGNALWKYSGTTWPITGEPGSTPKTWSQILADYPNAETRSTDSWFGFRIGEPYADGFTGNVDRVVIGIKSGTNTHTETYDFEPTVIEDDCNGGCGGDNGDNFTTTVSSHRSSRGGSSGLVSGASSFVPNSPEVAGAFTELPGLPDTGNAPIAKPETSSTGAVLIIFSGILALLALNFVSLRILKEVQK